jgi:ATPase subunit of ABC transporter with duplicated ATPase domains
MATISLENVGIVHPQVLFRGLTFAIGGRDRLGLVGNNGAGKSTLLRCLAGEVEPGEGAIRRSKGVPTTLLDLTLEDAIRRAIPAEQRAEREWRVGLALDALGAPEDIRDRPVRALSGGWQRLALLARTWVNEPDILLLDEPTNHLDLSKILALETWLAEHAADIPIVVVSHDRRFLDACTDKTLFVRPTASPLYAYSYGRARELLAADDRALETRAAKELKEVDRLRRSAHELRQVGVNNRSDAALRTSIQIARRAEAAAAALPQTHVEKRRDIALANRGTHAKVLLSLRDVTVSAPDGARLFAIDKLEIAQRDRLVVLGRNGTGKSCFIGLVRSCIADEAAAAAAGVKVSPSVTIGYVDQLLSQLPGKQTLRGFISSTTAVGDQRATSLLAGAGFPVEAQVKPIASLSPGEAARLALLALRLAEPNFYLLDEPTNHLDIAGQERLEAEILSHEATCLLVSHDRQFVANIGTRFCVIERGRLFEIDSPEPFHRAVAEGRPVSLRPPARA